MKGCLKQSSRAPSPDSHSHHHHNLKSVAFGVEEQVFVADEWDRTPTEPSRNLSYQDILELKEIQRSLPLAAQPPDLISGRPGSHYLKTVPIGLLPLLPETDSSNTAPITYSSASTITVSASSWRTVRTPSPANPIATHSSWHPAHLSHLPAGRPPIHREKPRFAFLPLLEQPQPLVDSAPISPVSPPPSERSNSPFPDDSDVSLHDPPTPSLTNASLDSSPLSRASSCSPEPSYLQLPPTKKFGAWLPIYSDEHNANTHDVDIGEGDRYAQPGAMFSSCSKPNALVAGRGGVPITSSMPKPTPKKVKKRNVIVVNDMEIELDGDDDDDETEDDSESYDDKDDKDQWRENEDIDSNTPPARSPSISRLSLGSASPTPAPSIPRSNMKMFTNRPTSPTPSPPTPSCHAPISFKRFVPSPSPSPSPLLSMNMSLSCSPKENKINTGGSGGGVMIPSA